MTDDDYLDDAALLEAAHKMLNELRSDEPEPGDTVVEYRDGEAWICVVPEPGDGLPGEDGDDSDP